jgi:hypothetical protein
MSDVLKKWRVGDWATRLILLRVEPGHELAVGRLIEKRCRSVFSKANSFRVFRLFGSYDLLVIQDNANLAASDFVNVGSIPYVTGNTEYICNKWVNPLREEPATFELRQLADPLLAMCFIKINPELTQQYGLVPELSFAGYAPAKLPGVQMLSTFGWAEVVVLISEKSLAQILDAIGTHLPALLFGYRTIPRSRKSFVEKTLTIIGHSLDVSDPSPRIASRAKVPISGTDTDDLTITFSVACKPRAAVKLDRSAKRYFQIDSTKSRLGARDIEFDVPLKGITTLNELLQKLDGFRRENSGALIRTHTVFKYKKARTHKLRGKISYRRKFNIVLSPADAKKLSGLGPEGAAIATAIYQFNSLVQNEISSDVYLDLLRFLVALKTETLDRAEAAGKGNKLTPTFLRALATKLSQLEIALAQRSQSVYAGLEENPFGVYPSGVGLQRITKALDAYAISILSRLGRTWNGFVRFGHRASRMEHFADVLIVPTDISVSASRHWTFTHETMHVLQEIDPHTLSLTRVLRSDRFGNAYKGTALQPGSYTWLVVLESMADVLDFALCCSLSLNGYLATIWKFLSGEIFVQQADSQWRMYLWRSFAVISYDCYCRSERRVSELFDRTRMLSLLKQHTRKFSKWVDLAPLTTKDERGQDQLTLIYERFLNDLLFYLPSIFALVDGLTGGAVPFAKKRTSEAIRRLQHGRIVNTAEIKNADEIAWKMAGQPSITGTRMDVAWLLSLWHYYQTAGLGPDIRKLTQQPRKSNRK